MPLMILVDADACPVKEEVYKVAFRHAVPVTIVSWSGAGSMPRTIGSPNAPARRPS